jgi:Retinal pigment epithelial membrane protein
VNQIGEKDGMLAAVTDAPILMQLNPVDLSAIGLVKYSNSISRLGGIELFSTSHPKHDINPSKDCSYNYFVEIHPLDLPLIGGGNIGENSV